MNEYDAIKYVLEGGHPGNTAPNIPMLGLVGGVAFLEAFPPEWRHFRLLLRDYWLPAYYGGR